MEDAPKRIKVEDNPQAEQRQPALLPHVEDVPSETPLLLVDDESNAYETASSMTESDSEDEKHNFEIMRVLLDMIHRRTDFHGVCSIIERLIGVKLSRDRILASPLPKWGVLAGIVMEYFAAPTMGPRPQLESVQTIEDVVRLISTSKNIMVLAGAGISVASGIPDFRGKGGLYDQIQEKYELEDPTDMFDLYAFLENPEPFFHFAKEIFPGRYQPTKTHQFIRKLEEEGRLLRMYTQNIDSIEELAGIQRVVQCHGSFSSATCLRCRTKVPTSMIREDVMQGRIPLCDKCVAEETAFREEQQKKEQELPRPRNWDQEFSGEEEEEARFLLPPIFKPDITFFGEDLPQAFDHAIMEDKDKVDLLIVIGSSLKVVPVARIPRFISRDIPQILINREIVGGMQRMAFDVHLLGMCDHIVDDLSSRLGWSEDTVETGQHAAPRAFVYPGSLWPPHDESSDEEEEGGEEQGVKPEEKKKEPEEEPTATE